ncbi:MAG: ATP-binding protein [Fimbriimonadaceae bacterium]|nr:ATP-binding protein [Fimbriimonadaceae bacterium]
MADFTRELVRILELPEATRAYEFSRWAHARFAEQAILETEDIDFNLFDFAKRGGCQIFPDARAHAFGQLTYMADVGVQYEVQSGLYEVLWQQYRFLMVVLSFGPFDTHWKVVGPSMPVLERFFEAVCRPFVAADSEIMVFRHGGWKADATLRESIRRSQWNDLILPSGVKAQLRADVSRFLTMRDVYERYRIPWKRGLLFVGPPGNGKSHAIKGLINEFQIACLYVRSFKSERSTVARNIEAVFSKARTIAPCMVVLEDVDSLIDKDNLSMLLNELDGFVGNTGLLTIATTNHPDRLDPALLERPSRFDRKLHFQLPNYRERWRYLTRLCERLEPEMAVPRADFRRVVLATEGFSFAYLQELLTAAATDWVSAMSAGRPSESFTTTLVRSTELLRRQMTMLPTVDRPTFDSSDDEDDD